MAHDIDQLQSVLSEIERWSVPHAGAAVFEIGRADDVRAGSGAEVLGRHGDQNYRFEVASITKLVTAWTMLIALEEGSVALEDAAGPPGSTVRHLLCHASGLPFEGKEPITPPGTRRIYSNTGYEILAQHLADRTGIAFSDYMAEAVLEPLGMVASELRGSPAEGLHSNVEDLIALGQELLRPTLIHTSTWAGATAAQFPDLRGIVPGWGHFDPCPWGFGPEIRGSKSPHWTGLNATPGTFGHFGGSGTFLWVDPRNGFGCVVLTDREFEDWAVEVWPPFSDAVRAAVG